MAGTSGISFRNPCHCCAIPDFDYLTVVALPQRYVDWANGYIAQDNCIDPVTIPDPPAWTQDDLRSALLTSWLAAMSVDFDSPPVPWSGGADYRVFFTNLQHTGIYRGITGGFNQDIQYGGTCGLGYMINPPDNAAQFGPKFFETPQSGGFPYIQMITRLFHEREPLPDEGQVCGFLACNEINAQQAVLYDRSDLGMIVLPGARSIACPFAFTTRVRFTKKDAMCVSHRKIHVDEGVSGLGFPPCGPIGPSGTVVSPLDPRGDIFHVPPYPAFDLAGITDNNGIAVYDRWQEGACVWINVPCEDCLCT